jgi:hypothetical protein
MAGFVLIKLGLVKARGAPSLKTYLTRLVPIVLCSAGSLGFGNAAYLSLSVSFVQILKVRAMCCVKVPPLIMHCYIWQCGRWGRGEGMQRERGGR